MAIRVTVWNEFAHEKTEDRVKAVYPDGIHMALKRMLECDEVTVRTATLDDEECGLTQDVLDETDVLVWWGHMRHHLVPDEVVQRVYDRVMNGMGIICLHSAHNSKIFKRLMGTTCSLRWHEIGEHERIAVIDPAHPICQGLPLHFVIDHEEMYGERFDIPTPDELLMLGWFPSGEVFRSGCVWRRGHGKVFYFQPGHETFPNYVNNENIATVIRNAVRYVAPAQNMQIRTDCIKVDPLEPYQA